MSWFFHTSKICAAPLLLTLSLSSCDVLAPPTARSASVGNSVNSDERSANAEDNGDNNSDDATAKKGNSKSKSKQSDDNPNGTSDPTDDNTPTLRPADTNQLDGKTDNPNINTTFDPSSSGKGSTTSTTTSVQTSTLTSPVQTSINPATQSPLSTATATATSTTTGAIGPTQTKADATSAATSTTTSDQKICFLVGATPDRQQVDPQLLLSCNQVIAVQVNCGGKTTATTTQIIQLSDLAKTRSAYATVDSEEKNDAHSYRGELADIEFSEESIDESEDSAATNLRCSSTSDDMIKTAIARTSYHKCAAINVSIATIK